MNRKLNKINFRILSALRGERILKHMNTIPPITIFEKNKRTRYQIELINRVLRKSEHIDFYKKKYREIFRDNYWEINNLEDFSRLPLLEKNELRMWSENFRPMNTFPVKTSGTIGTPLRIQKSSLSLSVKRAIQRRLYYYWYGIELGDREARFFGVPLNRLNKYKTKIIDTLIGRLRFSAFNIDDKSKIEFYAVELHKFKPDYIYGYPSLIEKVGKKAEELNIVTPVKAVIITAEQTDNKQVERISKIFKSPVAVEYGCAEVGIIAFSCPYGTMHVIEDAVFTEVIDEDGKSINKGRGIISITDMYEYKQPLIRYTMDDIATIEYKECNCGISGRVLTNIIGRAADYFTSKDKAKSHILALAYAMYDFADRGLKKFKFIDRKDNTLELLVETNMSNKIDEQELKRAVKKIGPDLNVDIKFVDHIPPSKSGKFSYFEKE